MEMVITTKITYKYLMNKSKHDLAYMVLDLLDKQEKQAGGLTPLAADGACTCGNYLPTPGSSYPYPCFNCGKRPAAKA